MVPYVDLPPEWAEWAAWVGSVRQARNRGVRRDTYAPPGGHGTDGVTLHQAGAMAALAFAHFADLVNGSGNATKDDWNAHAYLDSNNATARPVRGFYVRSTRHQPGHLPLHPGDPDDNTYTLVIIDGLRFHFPGSIVARYGKDPALWEQRGSGDPCYWVPRSLLHPWAG